MSGNFVISLDLELMWGVRDKRTLFEYGRQIRAVREVVPHLLRLFDRHRVSATWASVGFLFFDDKQELLASLPDELPTYSDRSVDPYTNLDAIGQDERADPHHFGASLIRQILASRRDELASHTHSHFYVLDAASVPAFRSDLETTRRVAKDKFGQELRSLVFPRNQYDEAHVTAAREEGFVAYRGNPDQWFFRPSTGGAPRLPTLAARGARLLDAYVPIRGDSEPADDADVQATRFLRACRGGRGFLDRARARRIVSEMSRAAAQQRDYHLWWHPHNFGNDLATNLSYLDELLAHHVDLRSRHRWSSATMAEVAERRGREGIALERRPSGA